MTLLPPPTDEQVAIIDQMRIPDSTMVQAFAGCAKTTTIEMAAKKVRIPALALAFNASIAKELKPRLPPSFKVQTLNAFGFAAWTRAHPAQDFQIDDKKVGKLISQNAKDRRLKLASDQWEAIKDLVGAAQLAGIAPNDEGRPLLPDSEDSWSLLGDDLMIPEPEWPMIYEIAREVLESSVKLAKAGVMTFNDQIYCPTILGSPFPKFPIIFLDEAQDLSPLNHYMLSQALREDAKLVAVGDPKQAIYAFRGADANSMEKIRGLRPAWVSLPLATTFRCPKVIVGRQQSHAPGFRAWHTNPEGTFGAAKRIEWKGEEKIGGWNFGSLQAALPTPQASLAILCRNNSPLLSLAFRLIRNRVGPVMLGRDLGKGLISFSRKLLPEDGTGALACAAKITDWLDRESALAIANGEEEKVAGLRDRAECLRAVLEDAGVQDAGQMRAVLEGLFSREGGMVTLGSIHKAKGREWDVVVHLDPWRIPSKWAKEAAEAGDPRQLEQEWNLKYVCETRTKFSLINANLEDWNS